MCVDRASYASRVTRRYQAVSTHLNGYAKICVVGIATRLRAPQPTNNCGSIPGTNIIFSLFSKCPDGLWGPPSLLFNGYRGRFLRGVKLATHLHLVPCQERLDLYLHFPVCLRGVYSNKFTFTSPYKPLSTTSTNASLQ
jgi:hypothetical protein